MGFGIGSIISAGASILGGVLGNRSSERQADQNAELQREFAQNGIQWKVEDAKKAGVHPLYALGANTNSFAPIAVGDSFGSGLASAGQEIGRAIDSTRTSSDRAVARTLETLQLERAKLENDLLRSQITSVNRASNPPMAGDNYVIPGQTESGVVTLPSEVVTGSNTDSGRQPGGITEYQFTNPGRGGTIGLIPSQDMKNRMDDDFIASTLWHLQHRLVAPPSPDKKLFWNPLVQRYVPKPWLRENY